MGGLKIVGIADKKEKDIISQLVIEEIIKRNPDLKYFDFSSKIKKLKIYFCEKLPRFSGMNGGAIFNKVFIPIDVYNYLNKNNMDEIKKSDEFKCLFHEYIHFIQGASISTRYYKSHDMKGLIEGATEKETVETLGNHTSTFTGKCQYNFKTDSTSYVMGISLMQQLEVLYGRDIVKQFTFFKNKKLVDCMINDLGEDLTFLVIDSCKKYAAASKKVISFELLQNKLMHSYFDNKINTITSLEEAKELLHKLKNLGNKRIKVLGSTEYENFYNKILFELKSRYKDIDSLDNSYQEPVYYETSTLNDRYKRIKDLIDSSIIVSTIYSQFDNDTTKRLNNASIFDKFESLNLNNYKIYEYVDSNIFLNMVFDGDNRVIINIIITDEKRIDKSIHFAGKIENGICKFNKDNVSVICDVNNKKVIIDNKSYNLSDKTKIYLSKKNIYTIFKKIIEKEYKYSKGAGIPSYDDYEEAAHKHR